MKKIFTLVVLMFVVLWAQAQSYTLKGVVKDSTGPIPGAVVLVNGTDKVVTTDADGAYSIKVEKDQSLTFKFIGYQEQTLVYYGQNVLDVVLEEVSTAIDEVIVIGYGTRKRSSLTGSVDAVGSEDIANRPTANLGSALQGLIPNLNITISDGSPNTAPSFNVRGEASFSGASTPLTLIDGVEGDMNLLNPEDIESVTVLKDASSAAIYGARAAFGVVLVTTKSGKKGDKITISYSNSFQWSSPTSIPDLMDSYDLQVALNTGKVLTGGTISDADLEFLERLKLYRDDPENNPVYYTNSDGSIQWVGNTNPYDEGVNDYAPMQKHNLSISGGSEKTKYYISAGLLDQDGIYTYSTDKYTRYNALVNVTTDITDWWTVGAKVSYNNSTYNEPVNPSGKGGWWFAMSYYPTYYVNMPMLTPEDSPVGVMYTDNILSFMDYGSNAETINSELTTTVNTEFRIIEGLSLKGDFTYRKTDMFYDSYTPTLERIEFSWDYPVTVHTDPSQRYKAYNVTDYFAINAYIDFNRTFGKHSVSAVVGFNQESSDYTGFAGWAEDLNEVVPTISNATGNQYAWDGNSEWAVRGLFFRANYDYDNRYMIEFSGRYDGTSKFPAESRFAFFPTVSGLWRISQEQFMESTRGWLNHWGIRASYGQLGNQNVSNYMYQSIYGSTYQVSHVIDGSTPSGVYPGGIVSSDLTWETATTFNIGTDISLFGKLDVSFDWYNRTTTDILTAGEKLPSVLGTDVPTQNSGTLETKGWELSIKWKDIIANEVRYDIAFNLADSRSYVKEYDGNPNNLLSGLREGQEIGEIWGYLTDGLFQTQAEIDAAPNRDLIYSGTWYPGEVNYRDLDGDNQIDYGDATSDDPGDKVIIGNSQAHYTFGINGNLYWKGFDFNIFFQGVLQRDWVPSGGWFWGGIYGSAIPVYQVYENSWTPDNPDAYYPVHASSSKSRQTCDRYLQNAAYIRLKNISLGYTIPSEITRKFAVEKLRVYVSGLNLWEASGLENSNFDPETLSQSYPVMRSFAFGLQVTF